MLTYSINIFVPLSFIFFGLLVTEQGIAHPVQIPVYSKHCRDIKNRFGRVVGQECVERFSTKRKPPAFGFGHADINKFIAWDSMQVKHDPVEVSTNKVPPSIRTTLRTTTKPSTTSTTSTTTTTTTTKRPIIEPNPEDNTNPDYENVFHPVSSTSTGSTPTEKEREEEKKIIDDVEDEYPDGDEEYPDESKETPEEKPETENKGTEEDEEEDYEYDD